MSIDKSLDVWCGLFVDPRWEVGLSLIDLAGPRRTVIHIHGDLDVVAILLNGRKILNLLEAALVGLTGSHAAVNGDGAGVCDSAARRTGEVDLRNRASTTAKEAGVLIVVRVVLGIKHLCETANGSGLLGTVVVKCTNVVNDVSHLVDGVVTTLRSRTMARNTLNVNTDLHTTTMTAINAAIGRLG